MMNQVKFVGELKLCRSCLPNSAQTCKLRTGQAWN